MPRTALRRVGQRLTELGCPPAEIRRRVRELAEHHEDLVRDAREEGLSETEAEARADARLGEPQALAERLAASFRHCSWWGRHPILGFCVVPPLAIIPSFVMALWVEYLILHLWLTSDQIGALGEREFSLKCFRAMVLVTYYCVLVLAAGLFCRLAGRAVRGYRWAYAACALCALEGAFFFARVESHSFSIGFINQVNWTAAALPLAVAFPLWWRLRRTARRLALAT